MKTILLLSSTKFLADNPSLDFDKPLNKMKMAYITTASKGVGDLAYMERAKGIFDKNGYDYEELDLDGKNEKWLEEYLSKFDVVYVQGGNTFYLLKSIRESGFDKVIKKLLPKGLIYIGASAGAYVACPSIEMMMWKGNKYDHYGVTDLTGMNLVPFLVSVHYSPEYFDLLKEKSSKAAYPVRILNDRQAILVKDDKAQFIGEGEEVVMF